MRVLSVVMARAAGRRQHGRGSFLQDKGSRLQDRGKGWWLRIVLEIGGCGQSLRVADFKG
jgi:hypothetical protein